MLQCALHWMYTTQMLYSTCVHCLSVRSCAFILQTLYVYMWRAVLLRMPMHEAFIKVNCCEEGRASI